MKEIKRTVFLIINILIPIGLGAVIYYLVSPDVLFVKQIDLLLGKAMHFEVANDISVVKFIRNYFLDMLWAYALVFALSLIICRNAAQLWETFMIAFIFSAILELLQITPVVQGTFDIWDIMVELIAELVAVFIIKISFLEEVQEKYEKEN